ncbi:TauD/TfdA family dioxygenase [Photorhabdus sp. SF281]|uniref:TauD/TfdA family dioxygenase n=1 Tax=Photorhabdus sp. SF281 TaxID=3459527 RepID=UPI004044D87B
MYNDYPLFNNIKKIINSDYYNFSELHNDKIIKYMHKDDIERRLSNGIYKEISSYGSVYVIDFYNDQDVFDISSWIERIFGKPITYKNRGLKEYETIKLIDNPRWFFESNGSQPVHTDEGHEEKQPDIVALYCQHPSYEGGDSILVDSGAVYNFILKKYGEKSSLLFNDECIVRFSNDKFFQKRIFSRIEDNIGISFSPLLNNFKCTEEVYSMLMDINIFIHQKENQCRLHLRKNQCIVFSNYLYLHSRTRFPKDSQRTLFRFWF